MQDQHEVTVEVDDRHGRLFVLVRLGGALDLTTEQALSDQLEQLLGLGHDLVLDLDGIAHLSASCVRRLLHAGSRARTTGRTVTLVCAEDSRAHMVLRALGVPTLREPPSPPPLGP